MPKFNNENGGKMNKKLILSTICAGFIGLATSALGVTLGTGSQTGVFYPFGQKICASAAEAFVDCTAPSTGGSTDNVNAVMNGERETGLAMLKVAVDSGLPYKETLVGEGSFIVTNKSVSDKIMAKVAGNEAAVYAAAIKLAGMGRIVFVTIGETSGETTIMKEQLAQVSAPDTALVIAKDQDALLSEVGKRDNAFGYFSRVPLSDNSIFLAIAEKKLQLMGAFNPAFKQANTVVKTVEVAGVTVKTPVMPIAIVYKDETNKDVADVVKAAQGIILEDLVQKKTGLAKFASFLAKWTSKITTMTTDAAASLSDQIQDAVANMKV